MTKSTNTKQLKKGFYENFGKKESRKLRDKYETGYMGAERENMDLIQEFESWGRNVSDKDLR